jgi:lipopolysaccharide export LptBFGC system permease protein LptF
LSDNHGNNYLIDEGWFEQSRYDYFKDNNEIINAEILGYIRYPTQKKMFTPENSISSNEWYYYDLEQIQTFLNVKINQKFFIKNMSNIFKEFYKRFIIPFYIPILCLIPFLLITSSKENLNYNKIRLATFLIGFFAIIFSETTIRFISNVDIQNIGIIISPILIFLLIYFYLFYKFNFQIL